MTLTRDELPTAAEAAPVAPRTPRRHDIDGLRALAIALVVIYHVWLGRVSGGVDVFLMLSAFFLTASFARRIDARRPMELRSYWARTFKRLVPASAVTLGLSLVASLLLLPPSSWSNIWNQTWASLFYFQNWQLAGDAVDYYAQDGSLPSVLQHYWSLSIQGQVFVLWPILLAVAAFIVRRQRWNTSAVLGALFGAVFAVSFIWSILETAVNQSYAYFDTGTRLWEFALGSLVAIALPHLRVPRQVGALLTWLGVLGIVFCGILLDVQGGFPGFYALWPTLCAAAVIVGGRDDARWGASRPLSSAPLRFIARDAYALYLVHWPILILWRSLNDGAHPDAIAGLGIIAASLLLARGITALVETPLRDWNWVNVSRRRSALVVLASVLVVAVPLGTWQFVEQRRAADLVAQADTDNPGAQALLPGYNGVPDPDAEPLPTASMLPDEWTPQGDRCRGDDAPDRLDVRAECYVTGETEAPERTIVVVGDSHSRQYMGALLPVAERHHWKVISVLRGACAFGLGDHPCADWNAEVMEYVVGLSPDAVYAVVTASEALGNGERLVTGMTQTARTLQDAGIELIGLRDSPRWEGSPFGCAEENGIDSRLCGRDRSQLMAEDNPAAPLADLGATLVDFTDYICPDGYCGPVVGNVFTFMDFNHLTLTFTTSLSPILEDQIGDWIASPRF